MKNRFVKVFILVILVGAILCNFCSIVTTANAMPFYSLNPQKIVLRASFSTDYSRSSSERKNNIEVATRSLNNSFIDVGGEFSFNKKVGVRTEERGYKTAKIIKDGEFIEGVGGGVCQVSTTLYNACLLANLEITEYHQHSLAVSYVEASFDAMVNSGSADLRVKNNTDNPIIIKGRTDGEKITISIYGEKLTETIERISLIKEEIDFSTERIIDDFNEYPYLAEGEEIIKCYGKKGKVTEGFLRITKNGKVKLKKIRRDRYAPITEKIIVGKG